MTGVGEQLLDELFYMPAGMNPELEKAIEAFYAKQRARTSRRDGFFFVKTMLTHLGAERYAELSKIANGAGVKAFTAKNEMAQMDSEDQTATNREVQLLNSLCIGCKKAVLLLEGCTELASSAHDARRRLPSTLPVERHRSHLPLRCWTPR